MKGTFYFSYRRCGAYAPVRLGCYSKEQAFWLANQKWQEGHHDKYTLFVVEYVECGNWETVFDFLTGTFGTRFLDII